MTLDKFMSHVRELEAMLPGCYYVEEPVEELLPVVAEIEKLRAVEQAARAFLERDVGAPTSALADALDVLDADRAAGRPMKTTDEEGREMLKDTPFMEWLKLHFDDFESEPTVWMVAMHKAWAEGYSRGYGDAPRS